MRHLTVRLAALGAVLVALVIAGLLLHVPGAASVGSVALTRRFVALMAIAGSVYLLASHMVVRSDGGGTATCVLVLVVAVAMRIPALSEPPFLSSDLYRYIWDGRVQLAGINPYRHIPANPALAGLRDHAIYDHVNRRTYAATIYPPAAELAFRLYAAIRQTALTAKLGAVAWEALAVGCLMATLRCSGQPASRVLLYAWNPLAVWAYAGNGHVDAEAVGLLSAALFARARRRDGWAGAALGAAFLVKFLPAAIAPALWRGRWRLPLVFVLVVIALYVPFLSVGPHHLLGFLGGYGDEEGFRDGKGVWLLAGLGDVVPLPRVAVPIYGALVLATLGLAALVVARAGDAVPAGARADVAGVAARAGFLSALTMILLSPHYPWYFPFLAIFAVPRPSRSLVWMSVAPLALYLTPWHEFFFWPSIVYVPAIVMFVLDEVAGRERARGSALRASERILP